VHDIFCAQEIEQSGSQTRYSGAPSESIQSTLGASSHDVNGQTKAPPPTSSLAAVAAGMRRGQTDRVGGSTSCGCCGRVWSSLAECLRAGPGAARRRRYDSMRPQLGVAAAGTGQINSVSQIDTVSRFLFPFAFVSLNILYWAGFLYYF